MPWLFRKAVQIGPHLLDVREGLQGLTMAKRTGSTTQTDIDKCFLLQSLKRLKDPEQRYVFTLIADLISLGLEAAKAPRQDRAAR
jgi:hypothetical protein